VVDIDRNMMLTPDEYMAIMRLVNSERESEGAGLADRRMDNKPTHTKTRRVSQRSKNMSKAIQQAMKKMKKANGQFRKGKSMSDVMRLANKLADKM
tara:strand:- start:408 stop:695 length:288 start_codon:yes stop_codon:yes gene_type:complete